MKHESNLTSKGQVTIPKDIRDALGLKAGQKVRFELDEDGNARIVKPDDAADGKRREAEFFARLREVQRDFGGKDRFGGMDGLAYQRWIRGAGPEV